MTKEQALEPYSYVSSRIAFFQSDRWCQEERIMLLRQAAGCNTDTQHTATTVLPQTTAAAAAAQQGSPTTVTPVSAAASCIQQLRRSLQLQIQFQLHILDCTDYLDGLDSLFHGPQIPTQYGARPSQPVAPAESARSLFVYYQQKQSIRTRSVEFCFFATTVHRDYTYGTGPAESSRSR